MTTPRASVFASVLLGLLRLYRRFLSPLLPPACRFEPHCSAYAQEAISKHGAARGSLLTVRRLLRCHPISWLGGSSGFDPVPPCQAPLQRKASPHGR